MDHENEHHPSIARESFARAMHWDLLRYFLAVAEAGSIRSAAETLNSSVNVVRNRIDELEVSLNSILFLRSSSGVELTADGRAIYPVALEMQQHFLHLRRMAMNNYGSEKGLVRLGVTEGLGSFWLSQKIPDLIYQRGGVVCARGT
ncbi:MAG: LysR family transcriptional regulator [Pseudomonadota bacterium]